MAAGGPNFPEIPRGAGRIPGCFCNRSCCGWPSQEEAGKTMQGLIRSQGFAKIAAPRGWRMQFSGDGVGGGGRCRVQISRGLFSPCNAQLLCKNLNFFSPCNAWFALQNLYFFPRAMHRLLCKKPSFLIPCNAQFALQNPNFCKEQKASAGVNPLPTFHNPVATSLGKSKVFYF